MTATTVFIADRDGTNWTPLGTTDEGVEITRAIDHEIAAASLPITAFRSFSVSVKLSTSALENLAAWLRGDLSNRDRARVVAMQRWARRRGRRKGRA